ncbi:hypothetical protein vseg_007706 [Gypsophila vaccaria]
MVIRTFTAEPKKKLKKLKSVKVANLDRLRLSMRREKSKLDRSFIASSVSESSSTPMSGISSPNYMKAREKSRLDSSFMASSAYETDPSESSKTPMSGISSPNYMKARENPSESSSTPMSGISSPNYMKATSSSSARKGSSKTSSSTVSSTPASKTATKSELSAVNTSKVKNFCLEECSDTVGVNIPVKTVRQQKGLKRMPSVKNSKKLASMKSMKIRAKYSQFQGYCNNNDEFSKGGVIPEESSGANYGQNDQESMVGNGDRQKSILSRSRSIKMTRLRSKRYTKRPPKSRFGEAAEQTRYRSIPHYMKGTSSHEARKNTEKGLTRTSSWRPLRILAKIPSLRQRNSKVNKRPLMTQLSRTRVGRATCSSALKRSEFPDHMELQSGGREAEGMSTVHVCPYSYCSLNGHHHHAPLPPLQEFISAKRKLRKNQKGKQLKEDDEHSESPQKIDRPWQMISAEIYTDHMLNTTTEEEEEEEEEDDGVDSFVTIYAKPRKKWGIEGIPSKDSEELTGFTASNREKDYDWELPEAPSETSSTEGRQEALKEVLAEPHEILGMYNVEGNNKSQQKIGTITSNEAKEPLVSEEKMQSSGGELINILSDQQKYTNIWHLIYQQFVSSDDLTTGAEGISGADEKESGAVNDCHKGNELEQVESQFNRSHKDDVDDQEAVTQNLDFDQMAALKFVQDGLNAMLERDGESMNQQSKSGQCVTNSLPREYTLAPEASTEEQIEVGESRTKMEITVSKVQQKVDPSHAEIPRPQMSKSYNKLRKIFGTAKIIKAMERMKKIKPRQPRYLPVEPTSEEDKVYLRHLSRNERKNTEEWMLDYALRWAVSKLGPDQQRRVTQLVEAFETLTPEQREGIKHYDMKGKPMTTNDLATLVDQESEHTMSIPDEQFNPQHDDEGFLSHKSCIKEESMKESYEDQTRATDVPLESSENSCQTADTQINDVAIIKEPIIVPDDPSQSPTATHTSEMSMMLFNKQKYTCVWNLIYQEVASTEALMDGEQGANVFDEEEKGDKAIRCKEFNGPELTSSSYNTNIKEEEDDRNAAGGMNESDQSAAVKLVKDALSAILTRYEQSSECQAIPDHQKVASCTDESLGKDGKHLAKQESSEGEEKMYMKEESIVSRQQVERNESKMPPREMSKSYNRLRKAFVTAKFIKAMQRLRVNSPRKSQSLPAEASFKEERVYLRHLSIDGRKIDEECMLDYALRQVISKMAPDQQRRVAQLVEAFETVTPPQKDKGLTRFSTETGIAAMDGSATYTSVSLRTLTEEMHERSTADETTLQKNVEAGISETVTEVSPSSLISTTDDVATEVSSIRVGEALKDEEVSPCFPTQGPEVKSGGIVDTILSDKQKYASMWQLIHQQMISSEESKGAKQELDEVDEDESIESNHPDSTQISCMEKVSNEKDTQSTVLNQSAAIKLVKEAINAILQSHEQSFDQQSLQYNDKACDDAKGLCDTSALAPTEEKSEGKKRAVKDTNLRSEDNLHEVDSTSIPLPGQTENNMAQKKKSSSHSKLKKLIITAKFMGAMERMRKMNWSKPRYLPPKEASLDERVYLRHLSIDGRKNHDEWMLDYALRKVISSLAPEQQRKVAAIVGAFETVTPQRKGNGLQYNTKEEFHPVIKSEPIDDEKEFVDSKNSSMVYDDHHPKTQDDRVIMHKFAPLARDMEDKCQTDIPNIKTEIYSETQDSDQVDLHIHHQASPEGCPVQETLTMREETDANTFKTPRFASLCEKQDREHNFGKGLFSDKQKTNSMWDLICQHLQSSSASEGGSSVSERLGNNDHVKKEDTSFEMMTDDDNDDTASSVTSELSENEAIKLVKETIDNILEGPEEMDSTLPSTLHTSALAQKPEKSLSTGYSKLRNLIICNKFIKTMQKMRKIHLQKQTTPTLCSGGEIGKARLKSSKSGEKKGTDEWMLDNVLQKAISGLTPAKQRRVALLVEAFEKVNPDQEETRTGLAYLKKESADATSISGNAKENRGPVYESSQQSSESPNGVDVNLDRLVTISNTKLAIDGVPQDKGEGRAPNLRKDDTLNGEEIKGDTPLKLTALPSVEVRTSSDVCKDPTDVSYGDEHRVPPNEMKTVEEQVDGHCKQVTRVDKNASCTEGLKDERNHSISSSKSLDRENNTSLWGLILQHVKTDIPEKEDMKTSTGIDADCNSENSSQVSPEKLHDKEVDIPTPTRFEFYESEAIQLVQEAINELLVLPDQEGDNQSMSSSTTSDRTVSNHVHSNGSEISFPDAARAETLIDTTATSEDVKAPTNDSSPSTYANLSRVIMCKRFVHAMSKMRQLKPQPPQELSHPTLTEAKETPTLRQTANGEKKSWEEGMLDHALQQVVGKLAPAQKKRVSLLVQAFEAVGSQTEQPTTIPTVGSFSSNRKPTKFRLSRSQVV